MNNFEIVDNVGYECPKIVNKIIKRILKKEKIKNSSFSIIFVDDDYIKRINREYRNIDKVTDVISFALCDNARIETKIKMLGDIYVSIPRMIKQADEYGHSQTREISFLVAHGLFHLLGYDHMTKADEEIMFGKQEEVLNEFKETKRSNK